MASLAFRVLWTLNTAGIVVCKSELATLCGKQMLLKAHDQSLPRTDLSSAGRKQCPTLCLFAQEVGTLLGGAVWIWKSLHHAAPLGRTYLG